MKREIRILGIDDAAFDKFRDRKTLIVGVFFRGGNFIDGVLSEVVKVDGTDATARIVRMVKKSKFRRQLRAIMLKGVAVAGFNIIDIGKLAKETKVPVIVIMRRTPDRERMKRILKQLGKAGRIKLIDAAGKIRNVNGIYIQYRGTTLKKAGEMVKISQTHSNIPEPIRVAHLIAGGVKLGESRGKA